VRIDCTTWLTATADAGVEKGEGVGATRGADGLAVPAHPTTTTMIPINAPSERIIG
jgi:hypothetical protein